MHISFIATVTALLSSTTFALVVPSTHYVHERLVVNPLGWTKRDPLEKRYALDKSSMLPMRIALTQSNLDQGPAWLDEVSSPFSKKFGQHWSMDQVRDAFAPSDVTVEAVREWLIESGIDAQRIRQSDSAGFLEFAASISEAEELLKTEYHVYEGMGDKQHLACDAYSLPSHLMDHVDFVMPTVQFTAPLEKRFKKRDIDAGSTLWSPLQPAPSGATFGPLASTGCAAKITPACLRELYGFPNGTTASVANALGIFETQNYYQTRDLDLFFKTYGTIPVGKRPIFDSIDGGVKQNNDQQFDQIGEADLDLEYAMTLVYPQNVTLYQVGDPVEGGDFNNFLDAIDGSYCTYEGGDDPNNDPVYPDNSTAAGAYKGPKACGMFPSTKVISVSYGQNEFHAQGFFYLNRQCSEYMKLGMMGTSILFSSGDTGVAGNSIFGAVCINTTNGEYELSEDGGRFAPSFPSTCPYVTSVGATQVIPGTNVTADIASGTEPEMACETVIYSGGGFSDQFAIPSYQNATVLSWFKNHKPNYPAGTYNASMKSRAYPDISANGANYNVAINGSFELVYGTSASSPTLASILVLINEKRAAAKKSSVGFINPTSYANPQVFNDITKGNNPGCNTTGFAAVTGWDPVTGLGTPNYAAMLKLWMSLP